ncbi:Stemmadenine O-acetyltransferase [Camellia lanceoleosa]|uniref:Stemmadenine O-acetyltransferase n=1 Tax=Camellia lanceoleosa TaxID=1840588 RepID=A0ACC0IE77_9ERIC|nr:Stemmadenine O-acetyltransferase [Camellia lanceoleosa]
MTRWAVTARKDGDLVCPQFDSAMLFPPKDISGYKPTVGMTKEVIVTKRFVFSNSAVAALRDKYTDSTDEDSPLQPTRVEVLSVFIWTRFADSTEVESGPKRNHTVIHAVNLHPRMDPPLPEHSFGNLYWFVMAIPSMDSGDESRGLVRQMREMKQSVDGDFVTKVQEGSEHLNFITEHGQKFIKGEVVSFNFTSLCRLPLYETDFGWGRPVRMGSVRLPFKNLVTFMETGKGDGIEAGIHLEQEETAKFEAEKELLAYIATTYE